MITTFSRDSKQNTYCDEHIITSIDLNDNMFNESQKDNRLHVVYRKEWKIQCLTLYFPLYKDHLTDLYFFDFVPFFADFAAFFFAAIFIYIEKGTYISFLIMKIKNVNLV